MMTKNGKVFSRLSEMWKMSSCANGNQIKFQQWGENKITSKRKYVRLNMNLEMKKRAMVRNLIYRDFREGSRFLSVQGLTIIRHHSLINSPLIFVLQDFYKNVLLVHHSFRLSFSEACPNNSAAWYLCLIVSIILKIPSLFIAHVYRISTNQTKVS